ncbi:GerMN domain-containing protein [Aneurinibacillus sp. UBA3580]|jgi:germination protein M|uniref:GerMN domain-containing protein n=1 Tax=Aneurinibacillus sp. UBA3580 TaxID=1946041 RepID=UPI0025806F2C|nr:GerMN domain-containing protein [Aneurinibacillus sp. UBA3580]
MARRLFLLSAFMGLLFVLSGCGLFGPKDAPSNGEIDPPRLQSQPAAGSDKVNELSADQSKKADKPVSMHKVYVLDTDGFVVPWEIELPKSEGMAKQVLNYMVQGSEAEKSLPPGFRAVLPKGTKVLGMTIKDGVATVDFSPEFKKYKAEDEQKILDAVTWALTEFDAVKEVNIWINGHPQEVMPVKGTPISHLSRENGINMELSDAVKPGQAMPVTLYFQNQVSDNLTYFVPVTRLIPETDNKGLAVVKQLIEGPKQGSPLFSALLPSMNVKSVKQQKDIMIVDFDNKILSYNQGQASPDALESVVLSLTENSSAQKVQIMVDGKNTVKAGAIDYTKPVTRSMITDSQAY